MATNHWLSWTLVVQTVKSPRCPSSRRPTGSGCTAWSWPRPPGAPGPGRPNPSGFSVSATRNVERQNPGDFWHPTPPKQKTKRQHQNTKTPRHQDKHQNPGTVGTKTPTEECFGPDIWGNVKLLGYTLFFTPRGNLLVVLRKGQRPSFRVTIMLWLKRATKGKPTPFSYYLFWVGGGGGDGVGQP